MADLVVSEAAAIQRYNPLIFLTLRVACRTADLACFAHRVSELRCLELAERHKKNCTLPISSREIGRRLATIRMKKL